MSRRAWLMAAALLTAVVAAACSSGGDSGAPASSESTPGMEATPGESSDSVRFRDVPVSVSAVLRGNFPDTDFSISSIDLEELRDGGPGKDGIPAIDNPKYVSQEEADEFLHPDEPVVALEVNGEARAYPLQILT